MEYTLKQISSLEKVIDVQRIPDKEIKNVTLLAGESFSYQVCGFTESSLRTDVHIESELSDYIKTYVVRNVPNDWFSAHDYDILTEEISMIPDVLVPLESQNGYVITENINPGTIWIKIDIPYSCKAGKYSVTVTYRNSHEKVCAEKQCTLDVTVLPCRIPQQKTIFTQWFYADCIADYHCVPVYSEAHWELIEKYICLARECGINMILTPIVTPPLDTAFGHKRTNVQLLKIEKNSEEYKFDFSLLDRWIDICLKNVSEYFEISHLFTQWGLMYCPNIEVVVDGRKEYLFGWHVKSTDESYKNFLSQMLPALVEHLKERGVFDKCYFHISDEPQDYHLEMYTYAKKLITPLIGENAKFLDALSHVEFYDKGLVDIPVPKTNRVHKFFDRDVKERWTYYCGSEYDKVGNRFIYMPSYRNRILGVQLYKYGMAGFLHWGYNFYNSRGSLYHIDPYITTSSDRAFQSGDGFSVYPGRNCALPSLRAFIFREALQDIELCRLLESYIGKDKVVELIDNEAGMNVTFFDYPRNSDYIPCLMSKIKQLIQQHQS